MELTWPPEGVDGMDPEDQDDEDLGESLPCHRRPRHIRRKAKQHQRHPRKCPICLREVQSGRCHNEKCGSYGKAPPRIKPIY